jgi:hypothetical protein
LSGATGVTFTQVRDGTRCSLVTSSCFTIPNDPVPAMRHRGEDLAAGRHYLTMWTTSCQINGMVTFARRRPHAGPALLPRAH